jgi:hypothetical protein
MVYNTQNCWDFLFFPSPSILENRKHNVSETGSVSDLRNHVIYFLNELNIGEVMSALHLST